MAYVRARLGNEPASTVMSSDVSDAWGQSRHISSHCQSSRENSAEKLRELTMWTWCQVDAFRQDAQAEPSYNVCQRSTLGDDESGSLIIESAVREMN